MLLHLIRHGQSTWNVEGRVQGQAMEVPLTSLGVRQAEGARDALAARDLAAVLSSDQTRALQTAGMVALVSHADTLRVLVTLLDGGTHRDVDWEAWASWDNGRVVTRELS